MIGILLAGLLMPAQAFAAAIAFDLNVEFDNGTTGAYASVTVSETSNGELDFEISLLSALGPEADLHKFYFNLDDSITGVELSSEDGVATAYTLSEAPPVAGGAGSRFDFAVNLGNGAGNRGNGVLQTASFLLTAQAPLSLSDLLEVSSTSAGIQVTAAAHVQGASLTGNANSETVGGMLPEPNALALLLVALLLANRRLREALAR